VTAALVGSGDDEQRRSTDPEAGAPRLVLGAPPAGLTVTGAVDLPLEGESTTQGTYWVYGDAGAADPFEAADLAVVKVTLAGASTNAPDGSVRTEVDGHPAWVAPPPDDPADLGRRSVFIEVDDSSSVALFSRTLTDAELLGAADDLDLGTGPLDPPARLADLDQVGTAHGALSPGAVMLPFAVASGHVVGYADEASDGERGIYVASVAGGDEVLAVARWALGATGQAVDVDGVEGWSGSPYGDGSTLLVWKASPTAVVAVTGFGIDEAALLAAAESVRAATDAEWADLLRVSETVSVPRDAQVGVSSGDAPGAAFAAYVDADGNLCLAYDESNGSSSESCGGSSEVGSLQVSTQRLGSDDIVLYGYTTLGTDGELRLEADDGSPVGLLEAYHDEGTLFGGVLSEDALPAEIVVRGADGTELGRAAVVVPGEGSGSSSGQATPTTTG
jgi:hypothetical protein